MPSPCSWPAPRTGDGRGRVAPGVTGDYSSPPLPAPTRRCRPHRGPQARRGPVPVPVGHAARPAACRTPDCEQSGIHGTAGRRCRRMRAVKLPVSRGTCHTPAAGSARWRIPVRKKACLGAGHALVGSQRHCRPPAAGGNAHVPWPDQPQWAKSSPRRANADEATTRLRQSQNPDQPWAPLARDGRLSPRNGRGGIVPAGIPSPLPLLGSESGGFDAVSRRRPAGMAQPGSTLPCST